MTQLSRMTAAELKELKDELVEMLTEVRPDEDEPVQLPEYVPLPTGPNEHLATFTKRRSRTRAR